MKKQYVLFLLLSVIAHGAYAMYEKQGKNNYNVIYKKRTKEKLNFDPNNFVPVIPCLYSPLKSSGKRGRGMETKKKTDTDYPTKQRKVMKKTQTEGNKDKCDDDILFKCFAEEEKRVFKDTFERQFNVFAMEQKKCLIESGEELVM